VRGRTFESRRAVIKGEAIGLGRFSIVSEEDDVDLAKSRRQDGSTIQSLLFKTHSIKCKNKINKSSNKPSHPHTAPQLLPTPPFTF
jgi:hypothetical protein